MKAKTLLSRVDSHVAAWAAATASLAAVASTEAVIIYSGPVHIGIPVTADGLYLNVVTGVNGTSPGAVAGWDVNPYGSGTLDWFGPTPTSSSGYVINAFGGSSPTLVDNIPFDTLIGPASTFGSNNGSEPTGATAFHFNSSNNYVGFRFFNESTGILNYGWLELYLGASFTDPARAIIGYAYESTGGVIGLPLDPPPDVPEPSMDALFASAAAGAIAVRLWHRRRRASVR
jgi:hypothetical protein